MKPQKPSFLIQCLTFIVNVARCKKVYISKALYCKSRERGNASSIRRLRRLRRLDLTS